MCGALCAGGVGVGALIRRVGERGRGLARIRPRSAEVMNAVGRTVTVMRMSAVHLTLSVIAVSTVMSSWIATSVSCVATLMMQWMGRAQGSAG